MNGCRRLALALFLVGLLATGCSTNTAPNTEPSPSSGSTAGEASEDAPQAGDTAESGQESTQTGTSTEGDPPPCDHVYAEEPFRTPQGDKAVFQAGLRIVDDDGNLCDVIARPGASEIPPLRAGTEITTRIGDETTIRILEEGEIFLGQGQRYQVVQAEYYVGDPVLADRAPGEGVLPTVLSEVAVPVTPAILDAYPGPLGGLNGRDSFTWYGDTYTLVEAGSVPDIDPEPPVRFEAAVDALGGLEQIWSGPLDAEVLCSLQPTDHLLAVVPGHLRGDVFRWNALVSQGRCSLLLPSVDRLDALSISAYDVTDDADFFEWGSSDFPQSHYDDFFADRGDAEIEAPDLGDRARHFVAEDAQRLLIRDGSTLWEIGGPPVDRFDPSYVVETARVVLARFDSSTRFDSPAVRVEGEQLEAILDLTQRRDDLRNEVLRGERERHELLRLYEHTSDALSAVIPSNGDHQIETTVLRAFRRDDTAIGDIVEVFECKAEVYADGTTLSGVARVWWSLETGRVIDERRRTGESSSGGAITCLPASATVDFTEADLRAAMATPSDPEMAWVEECIVERFFDEFTFEQMVDWGVTPDDPQIDFGPFNTYSEAETTAIAAIATGCGGMAAAIWVGADDSLPSQEAAFCLNETLGEERILAWTVSQIRQTEFDLEPLMNDAVAAIESCR